MDLHRRTFAALRHRNFRLFWFSQLVSLTGTWMHVIAQGWLVLELTDSPFWLGAVGAAGTLPILLFSLLGGVAADRVRKRNLLLTTQGAATLLALLLAVLATLGAVTVWHVLVIAFLLGTVNALDMPSRQAFVVEMVGREDLLNAIALNSFTFNAARALGPALAGAIVATAGTTACFYANAASFVPVVAALGLMRELRPAPARPAVSILADLREGFAYLARERRFQGFIGLVGAASLLGFPCITMLPAFARDVVHTDARGFGLIMGASGVGALLAALSLASRGRTEVGGRTVVGAGILFGATLALFAGTRSLATAIPLIAISGGAMVAQAASANTIIQAGVPDALRGRLMSIFTLVMMGGMPIGNVIVGALAVRFGTPWAVASFGAALCAAILAIAAARPEIFRPASRER